MSRFPESFLWGTATAAHQVEGNNTDSDFWVAETAPQSFFVEPSGDACDHFHRYPRDIALLAELGFRAYRFSVEWARIEPEEGMISTAMLDHYRRMCATCLEHGIRPVVTYQHFTSPKWMTADGGWADPSAVDRFARYCERVTRHLGDLIDMVCTLNEPNGATALDTHPLFTPGKLRSGPGFADFATRLGQSDVDRVNPLLLCGDDAAIEIIHAAHRKARHTIKAVRPDLPVGWTLTLADLQTSDDPAHRDEIRRRQQDIWIDVSSEDDFIGVQTYTREVVGAEGLVEPAADARRTAMGYEFAPEALEATIRYVASRIPTPIYVTENGIACDDDRDRIEYVRTALSGTLAAIADDIDVRGYFYWSLLDNFEWMRGYAPKFGMIAVDRETQHRTIKPSARWLGGVARGNELDMED